MFRTYNWLSQIYKIAEWEKLKYLPVLWRKTFCRCTMSFLWTSAVILLSSYWSVMKSFFLSLLAFSNEFSTCLRNMVTLVNMFLTVVGAYPFSNKYAVQLWEKVRNSKWLIWLLITLSGHIKCSNVSILIFWKKTLIKIWNSYLRNIYIFVSFLMPGYLWNF